MSIAFILFQIQAIVNTGQPVFLVRQARATRQRVRNGIRFLFQCPVLLSNSNNTSVHYILQYNIVKNFFRERPVSFYIRDQF